MKLKSYFSATVEAAMDLARRELGDEALLIHARPSTAETRSLGAFEVVFGIPPRTAASLSERSSLERAGEDRGPLDRIMNAADRAHFERVFAERTAAERSAVERSAVERSAVERSAVERPASEGQDLNRPGLANMERTSMDRTGVDRISDDVTSLRREIERMTQSLQASQVSNLGAPAKQPALYRALVEAELDPELARRVADGESLEDLFEVDPTLGRPGASRVIVALVGPPGAGKTTTLVKLAACYGVAARKPAHIISADVYRIAAADQLRSLASILGIGCTVVETAAALMQVLEEHRNKDFIFIDTPGLARGEMEEGADLAALTAVHPEIDTHLVLPASMKLADMARTIVRYEIFQPLKLLFTRMDETERFGALISESVRRALPVSFLSTGQQIPDDLEPATQSMLAALVFGDRAFGDPRIAAETHGETHGDSCTKVQIAGVGA